jgi:hypothetical protein
VPRHIWDNNIKMYLNAIWRETERRGRTANIRPSCPYVMSSNLNPATGYPNLIPPAYFNTAVYLKLGHNRIFLHSFQFIIR